jgi:hypothetical protein
MFTKLRQKIAFFLADISYKKTETTYYVAGWRGKDGVLRYFAQLDDYEFLTPYLSEATKFNNLKGDDGAIAQMYNHIDAQMKQNGTRLYKLTNEEVKNRLRVIVVNTETTIQEF